MPPTWTTEVFPELYTAIQSAVLNRDQVDVSTLTKLTDLFDQVFEDLQGLSSFPPRSTQHREALAKTRKYLLFIVIHTIIML